MGLRKARAYSKKYVRPYTRKSKKRQKAYIKAVPPLKTVKFNGGDIQSFNLGKHPYIVRMITEEKIQLRDNALEAGRMYVSKVMDTKANGMYYMAVKVYPHHILRENKTAAGAGADRLSSGMKHSFGITIGRAALVNPGKEVYFISCVNDKVARIARDALTDIKAKMPFRARVIFEKVA